MCTVLTTDVDIFLFHLNKKQLFNLVTSVVEM